VAEAVGMLNAIRQGGASFKLEGLGVVADGRWNDSTVFNSPILEIRAARFNDATNFIVLKIDSSAATADCWTGKIWPNLNPQCP